jgi:hypothetical protein
MASMNSCSRTHSLRFSTPKISNVRSFVFPSVGFESMRASTPRTWAAWRSKPGRLTLRRSRKSPQNGTPLMPRTQDDFTTSRWRFRARKTRSRLRLRRRTPRRPSEKQYATGTKNSLPALNRKKSAIAAFFQPVTIMFNLFNNELLDL